MRTVTLTRCAQCHLEWINEGEERCPRCRAHTAVPRGPVIVSGEQVEVTAVTLHGEEVGLLDKRVRRGLDILNLLERCPHSYITWRICPTCKEK